MHAFPGAVPESDLHRIEGIGQVEHRQPHPVGRTTPESLEVGEQQTVGHLDLVVVSSLRGPPLGDQSRLTRIRYVEHAGPHAARAEVANVERVARAHQLHAIAEAS